MYYVVRLKTVSECMGIRRSKLIYLHLKDQCLDFSNEGHPMAKFNNVTINGGVIEVLGEKQEMVIGEEIYFYKNNEVESLGKKLIERIVLGVMILPLDKEMIDYYTNAINEGYIFDEWYGEFEYLLGMMYEFDLKDKVNSSKYYSLANEKGFKYRCYEE